MTTDFALSGAGLGLRRAIMDSLAGTGDRLPDFFEVAPENWIHVGGRFGRRFAAMAERRPFVCHGLSLSLGSTDPLDMALLADIRNFLRQYDVRCYTEHLSYCSDSGHLYDLMPIPFTEEAIKHVSGRIARVQDFLGQRIGIENVSYYAAPSAEMSEQVFLKAVLEEADCDLLLDVNNVYVNGINHRYDPYDFIGGLPGERICYLHVAGHYDEAEDLKVDTHGADVIEPVWQLLKHTYGRFGAVPTLLERDFNFPPLATLLGEVDQIRTLQSGFAVPEKSPTAARV